MKKIISQKDFNQLITDLTEKYLHKEPNKEGELDLIFVELFNEDSEEGMLANLLDFDSNYEEKHYIKKIAHDMYLHTKFAMPKHSKINKVRAAMIQSILLLKYKHNHVSLRQMNRECPMEFIETFGMYYREDYKEYCTYQFQDEDIKRDEWSEEKMKQAGFDEFTILRIKKKQQEEETDMQEADIHAFLEVEGLYYDIEFFKGVQNPIELRRIKEIMLGEKVYE